MSKESHVQSAARSREVAASIADARRELSSMPFFVRPMVKRGFRKRTGRTMEEWEALCRELSSRLEAGDTKPALRRGLIADLERLKENFRTAPDRAAKGMGDRADVMAEVRKRAAARVAQVDELIVAIAELTSEQGA